MDWLSLQDVAKWIRAPGKAQKSPKGFPMFQTQEVQILKKNEAGVSGRGPLLLAENVDTIWYIETKDRKSPVNLDDCQRFLNIKGELEELHPERYIRGIMLTSAPFSDQTNSSFENEECLLIHVEQLDDDSSPAESAAF